MRTPTKKNQFVQLGKQGQQEENQLIEIQYYFMSQHGIFLKLYFSKFYYDTKNSSLLKFILFNKIKIMIIYVHK